MGEADFLVAFYRQEGMRLKGYLKPKGMDLTDELENATKTLDDKKYLNIYLLGVLSRYLTIKEESWLKAIERVFHNKNLEENKKIFCIARGA
jgi:Pyruvate/2-oxoacid:ferredoxin oxidoreductase gamma subunit